MKTIEIHNNIIVLIDGLDDRQNKVTLGIDVDMQLKKIAKRGEGVTLEQFYNIVIPDLIKAKFLFREGLI